MSKSLIIDHLVGVDCPMVAQEAERTRIFGVSPVRSHSWPTASKAAWTLSSMYRSPDVVAVLNETASKQGLSGAAWIAMTVENALQR